MQCTTWIRTTRRVPRNRGSEAGRGADGRCRVPRAQNLIEILAPIDDTTEQALAEVVDVLRIPRTSIEWVREGIALSRLYNASDLSSSSDLPPARFWQVTASPSLAGRALDASETITLALLAVQLRHVAGTIAPVDDTNTRVIALPDRILFEDGSEAAPLAVRFTISDDGSTALITGIEHLASERAVSVSGTLASALEAVPFVKLVA